MQMKEIVNKLDARDASVEGSNKTSKSYAEIGCPYMQDYGIGKDFTFQFIMSPFMANILSESEADTTYNDNCELEYLLNCIAFDYTTLRWMPVARMRANVEDAHFYAKGYELMQKYHNEFHLATSLSGIVTDWSDTEAKGLSLVIEKDKAEKLLKGCTVHWARSYQRVADRLSKTLSGERRNIVEMHSAV